MAIIDLQSNQAWVRPSYKNAGYVSDNYLADRDTTYNPAPFLQDTVSFSGDQTSFFRSILQHTYNISPRSPLGWAGNFYYRYRYFYQGNEIFSSLSLGPLQSARDVTLDIFSGFKEKNIVSSITVPAGSGVSVTNLSIGDKVEPYSEFPLELNIAKAGPTVVSGDIEIVFGNGRSWLIGISFIRVTVPISLLEANWSEGVSLRRSFLTSMFTGVSMAQTRKSLRKIPIRTQTAALTFKDKESSLRAWSHAREAMSNYFYFPLVMDETVMTQESDGNRIYCNTQYRRFAEGGLVLLKHKIGAGDASGDILGHQTFQVVTVTPTYVEVTGSGIESYVTGDYIAPMMKCLPNQTSSNISAFTRTKGLLNIEVSEYWDDTSLPLENETYTPTELGGLPVFDFDINEVDTTDIVVMQGGQVGDSGRGQQAVLYGSPYQQQRMTVVCPDRATYWDIIGFFNYVKGRGRAFWVRAYQDLFDLTGQAGDVYSFESDLDAADVFGTNYLWVEDAAGNKDIVQVLGIADITGGFSITCSTSAIVSSAVNAYQAIAVRMSSDEIEEEWFTTTKSEISFTVEEVQGIYLP